MADEDMGAGAKREYTEAIKRINATQFKKPGEKTEAFRALSKNRPGRTSAAARGLRVGSDTPTGSEEREQAVTQWKGQRPKGGGRGVAAPHKEWVAWGSRNPNRASMASKVLGEAKNKKKST